MSDTPPENSTGWWLADDGKYYAPEQHPNYLAPERHVEPKMPPVSDARALYSEGNSASGWSLAPTGEWIAVELSVGARSLGIRPTDGTSVRWVDLGDVRGVHEVEPASEEGVVGVELTAIGHDALTIRMQQSTLDSLLEHLQTPSESTTESVDPTAQREEAPPLPPALSTSAQSLAASSPLHSLTADLPVGSPPLPPPGAFSSAGLGGQISSEGSLPQVQRGAWTTRVRVLVFGGAAGLVLGSLLPWVQIVGIMSVSVAGTDGDGVFTLILGIVVALLFAVIRPRLAVAVTGLVAGAIAVLVAIVEMIDVSGRINDPEVSGNEMFTAQIGPGLWIVGIAALILLAGGIDAFVGVRHTSPARKEVRFKNEATMPAIALGAILAVVLAIVLAYRLAPSNTENTVPDDKISFQDVDKIWSSFSETQQTRICETRVIRADDIPAGYESSENYRKEFARLTETVGAERSFVDHVCPQSGSTEEAAPAASERTTTSAPMTLPPPTVPPTTAPPITAPPTTLPWYPEGFEIYKTDIAAKTGSDDGRKCTGYGKHCFIWIVMPRVTCPSSLSGTISMEDAGGTVVDEEFASAGSVLGGQEAVLEFDFDRDDAPRARLTDLSCL